MRQALVAALAFSLALPAAASAHATLESTTPGEGARVETAPRAVVLGFDQRVTALRDAIEVRDERGRLVSGVAHARLDNHFVAVSLAPLAKGAYTVRWKTISADGHVGRGVFTFGVGVKAPPVTSAWGASGPTTSEHVVRWLYFLSLAALIGGLCFRLVVVPGALPRATERRFWWLVLGGAVATIEVGIVAFLLRAEDALQLPLTAFLYGDLSPVANATRFGKAFIAMTLGFALVTALLFLGWLTERRRAFLWPALVLSLGLASGLSLSGHAADDRGWLSSFADWVHLACGTVWLGGLASLAVVVWPTAAALRREAFWRFSQLAGLAMALLLAAGVYLSFQRLPAVSDLWTAGYGRILLVKIGLVCAAGGWAAFHHFLVRPRLDRSHALLSRTLPAEGLVGVAILLVAAVLVDSKPPPRAPAPSLGAAPATAAKASAPSPRK